MQCEKPTKAGTPCKAQRPTNFHLACKQHASADEQRYGDLIYAAYRQGWDAGSSTAQGLAAAQIERLEARVAELEGAKVPARLTDLDGAQIVQVGRYSYRWTGATPLAVGDEVLLPENYVSRMRCGPGPWAGTVTALGTDYTGPLSTIVRRAEGAA